eukprot:10985645-Alexandrium_andersonii.AAC.1
MPAEAALSLTDPEYRAMAGTRLAMPVITSGLTCAKCRATLGPLGLLLFCTRVGCVFGLRVGKVG